MPADFYLKVDGVTGAGTHTGHTGELELTSWSLGAHSTTSMGVGGKGLTKGHVGLSELNVTKESDSASETLFNLALTGKHIASVILTGVKTGDGDHSQDYVKITLSDVFLTAINISGSQGTPVESLTFAYNKIQWAFAEQGVDNKATLGAGKTFDLKTAVAS